MVRPDWLAQAQLAPAGAGSRNWYVQIGLLGTNSCRSWQQKVVRPDSLARAQLAAAGAGSRKWYVQIGLPGLADSCRSWQQKVVRPDWLARDKQLAPSWQLQELAAESGTSRLGCPGEAAAGAGNRKWYVQIGLPGPSWQLQELAAASGTFRLACPGQAAAGAGSRKWYVQIGLPGLADSCRIWQQKVVRPDWLAREKQLAAAGVSSRKWYVQIGLPGPSWQLQELAAESGTSRLACPGPAGTCWSWQQKVVRPDWLAWDKQLQELAAESGTSRLVCPGPAGSCRSWQQKVVRPDWLARAQLAAAGAGSRKWYV